jgi:hypothetical protein
VLAFAGQVGMAERNSGRVADTGAEARWRNQRASVAAGVGFVKFRLTVARYGLGIKT